MVQRIDNRSLKWRGNAPVSEQFDDVYYSEDNGLEETEYVFITGIGAPDCWRQSSKYVIAETGFGTGLNFLATYKAWMDSGAEGRLTFVSVEKFPLSEASLADAHETFPSLAKYSEKLRAAWPPPSAGFHLRSFEDGRIQLLLLFGDAGDMFSELHGEVDAWYLDGFAPAKNPEMWTDKLFDQMARLSKENARFATFTAAGFVKRALRDRGFHVDKTKGYGRKRERLVGYLDEKSTLPAPTLPEWAAFPAASSTSSTIVIGAGIAGASAAYELHRRGHKVQLISEGEAASHVPAAILAPKFQRSAQPSAIFAVNCFAHACSFPPYANAWAEEKGVHIRSNLPEEKARLYEVQKQLGWDTDWLIPHEDGYELPKSGSLASHIALETLTDGIPLEKGHVSSINREESTWTVHVNGRTFVAENLIIACGMDSERLLGTTKWLGLSPKPGQIEFVSPDADNMPEGNQSYGGYVTTAVGDRHGDIRRTVGSTFNMAPETEDHMLEPNRDNSAANLASLADATGCAPDISDIETSWIGMRATTPDYLPYAGPVPNWSEASEQFQPLSKDAKKTGLGKIAYQQGLYLLTGFGAKGFQQAPLCAAYVASLICGDPLPLPSSMLPYLHPARHMIKSIKRRKSL